MHTQWRGLENLGFCSRPFVSILDSSGKDEDVQRSETILSFRGNEEGCDYLDLSRCQTCQLAKAKRGVHGGLLQGLPLPQWKWNMVTMEFVTRLPRTMGSRDAIWIILDHLTKKPHFLPIKKTERAEKLARDYLSTIVRLHGVPVSIMSDKDSKFTSISCKRSRESWVQMFISAPHITSRRTGNQREPTTQTLEDMLRSSVLE